MIAVQNAVALLRGDGRLVRFRRPLLLRPKAVSLRGVNILNVPACRSELTNPPGKLLDA